MDRVNISSACPMTCRALIVLVALLSASACHVFEDLDAYRSTPEVCEIENACDGCRPRNACGGCETLAATPDDDCGTCNSGVWACDGTDALFCDGDTGEAARNACGGCDDLTGTPGDACGTCDSGTLACDRTEDLRCQGDEGEDALNACGGCSTLDGSIGDACGTCDSGTLACDGTDALACEGDQGEAARNACGGCATLEGTIGEPCGEQRCMVYACHDTDPDMLSCVAQNLSTWYRDGDQDTWGTASDTVEDCEQPDGYVARGGDCDDGDGDVHPEATEATNDGLDNDCDGLLSLSPPLEVLQFGAPATEPGFGADQAFYRVSLSWALEVQSHEVTLAQWEAIAGSRPSSTSANCEFDTCAVTCVNFYEAVEYLNQRSVQDGLTPCYTLTDCTGTFGEGCVQAAPSDNYTCTVSFVGVACDGWRLPTEAEWEWLARGGTETAIYSGELAATGSDCDDSNLNAIAWYCGNAMNRAHRVGGKSPNRYGLYDALGNVAEWTTNSYEDPRPPPAIISLDPTGPSTGTQRVVRGGSWTATRLQTRAAFRRPTSARIREGFTGFRPVRSSGRSCDPDDHATDDAHCGCLGPCGGGTSCSGGTCQ